MKVQNLRTGDSFLHHAEGQSIVTDILKGAALCKSKLNPSFLVGADYDVVNFIPAKLTIKEVADIVKSYNIDEFAKFENYLNGIEIPEEDTGVKE